MTPARVALAAAIEAAATASREASTSADRVARAKVLVVHAEAAHETGIAGIEAARSAAVDRLAAGREGVGEVQAARARAQDAEDDLVAARGALARVIAAEDEADTERLARKAQEAVKATVRAVVSAEALEPLIEQTARLQEQLDARRAVLRAIASAEPWPRSDTRDKIEHFLSRPYETGGARQGIDVALVAEWAAAAARLATDAGAPLPGEAAPAPKGLRLAR